MFSRPEIEQDGFAIVRDFIPEDQRQKLLAAVGGFTGPGRRGLLVIPEIALLAASPECRGLVSPFLGATPVPVRAILFDKAAETNWLVPWHQDLTIAVRERMEAPGFGPWSVKDSIPHVQPPVESLEDMLTLRIHLDDATAENGALRVLAGTHRLGRLAAEAIREARLRGGETVCEARAGDALLMRPLLLHASSRSTGPGHRRILHLEYAGFRLPRGLSWHDGA